MITKKNYFRTIIVILVLAVSYLFLLWLISPGMFNTELYSENINVPSLDREPLIWSGQQIDSNMKSCEIGYWSLNKDIMDLINRHDIISHEITSTKGVEQDAASFNGTDSYIKIGHKDDFNIDDNNFAITVWIKLNQLKLRDRVFQIFHKGSEQKGYELQVSNEYLEFYAIDSKNRNMISSYPIRVTANEWHFVVVVGTDSDIYLYLDDQLLGQIPASVRTNNLNDLYIGYDPMLNEYWSGLIDELHIYNNCSHFVNF